MFLKLVLVLLATATTAFAQTQTAPHPTISAPVTGPGAMFPGLRTVPAGTSLADQGYVVTEYFVSGTAAGEPYTTRILVRRPEDPSRFSGIVVAEPMHASGNSWMFFFTRTYVMSRGHVSVEIAPAEGGDRGDDRGLESGALFGHQHTGGGAGQRDHRAGGRAAQEQRPLVAAGRDAGASHDLDGYVTVGGDPAQVPGGPRRMANAGRGPDLRRVPAHQHGRRPHARVDVPVIQIPTQTEVYRNAEGGNAYRRADGDAPGDQFRLYEVAGMPHNDSRESPTYSPDPCKMTVTRFRWVRGWPWACPT